MSEAQPNSPDRARSLGSFADLFSGSIVDKFLPGSESTLGAGKARKTPLHVMALTDDCGTFPVGCLPPTQDSSCPTADVSLPSCGLCEDTQQPPAGHCHQGFTEPCDPPPPTNGCDPPPPPPPDTSPIFCAQPTEASAGCPPPPPPPSDACDTPDCGTFTNPCPNSSTDCQTPATVDSNCTSHETSECEPITTCPSTLADCQTPATEDSNCTSHDTSECGDSGINDETMGPPCPASDHIGCMLTAED